MGRNKRTRYNALAPLNEPTWLVIRDKHHVLVSQIELAPGVDLARVLAEAIERLEADGWTMEEPPNQNFAGCYVRRHDVRWLVHIARVDPLRPSSSNKCSSWEIPRPRTSLVFQEPEQRFDSDAVHEPKTRDTR